MAFKRVLKVIVPELPGNMLTIQLLELRTAVPSIGLFSLPVAQQKKAMTVLSNGIQALQNNSS